MEKRYGIGCDGQKNKYTTEKFTGMKNFQFASVVELDERNTDL